MWTQVYNNKIDTLDQSAIFTISWTGTNAFAFEYVLNTKVSIPASVRNVRIQRATDAVVTCRCGLMNMKQTIYWSFRPEKRRKVDDRQVLKQSTGHNFESSVNRVKKASTVSSGRVVLVATVNVKTKPSQRSL